MKNILLFLFLPLYLFSQEINSLGDVDCNGEVNSEDSSLILQYVTGSIDSLPCTQNMNGLTLEQLEEIVTLINGQLDINYGVLSFDEWELKYDEPIFDDFLYGQEEKDGFLLVQYSRENQINSSASFGFNIHTGSDIDTINFNMDMSINIHTSWNPINSKTIPIKKGNYWVLENIDDLFATEVAIDKVYFLPMSSTTDNVDNVSTQNIVNKSICFPDGQSGIPISWSCLDSGIYVVPEGKNLYVTHYFSTSDDDLTIDGIVMSSSYSNNIVYTGVGYAPSLTNANPFLLASNQEVDGGNFNGFLIDALVDPVTFDLDLSTYTVPSGKKLYILQYFGESDSELLIDDVLMFDSYSNNIFYTGVGFSPAITFSMPVIVGENQVVSGGGSFNGYIVDVNYFE